MSETIIVQTPTGCRITLSAHAVKNGHPMPQWRPRNDQ